MGPLVTSAEYPFSGFLKKKLVITSRISFGSLIRPRPVSPQAISPSFGPVKIIPRCFSVFILDLVASLFHISGFIPGAINIGLLAASKVVEARSFAAPCVIFDIISALAGATTIISLSRLRRI